MIMFIKISIYNDYNKSLMEFEAMWNENSVVVFKHLYVVENANTTG